MGRPARRVRRRLAVVAGSLLIAGLVSALGGLRAHAAANLPAGFEESLLAAGLDEPTAMTFAPDGRLFVSERRGALRVIENGVLLPTPFLTKPVINEFDGRLVGVAFDPAFQSNGYVYVNYKRSVSPYYNRVSRFTAGIANHDVAEPGSEVVILEYMPGTHSIHQGEAIHFGPDGYLYVAVGDGVSPLEAQSLAAVNGKILRINPSVCPANIPAGTTCADGFDIIPDDNPFTNQTQYPGARGEIWALGFRNPFNFAFDPVDGRMYIEDVGENSWEEINEGFAGANYGWPQCEGACGNPGFQDPAYSYDHSEGCAITGAAFYRDSQFPADYFGSFLFVDHCSSWIKRLQPDGAVDPFATNVAGGVVDLAMGPDGSLYYLSNGQGAVYRIRFIGSGNQRPVASISANPVAGSAPLVVNFSGAGSTDPDGDPLVFSWDFGDGSPAQSGSQVAHVFSTDGPYTARLTVDDQNGGKDSATVAISVGNPPVGTITSPLEGTTFRGGDVISYAGTGTDLEDGLLPAGSVSWKVVLHHHFIDDPLHHSHPFRGPIDGVTSGTFEIPRTGHVDDDVWYRVHLTVTDSSGLQHESTRDILPVTSTLTLDSDPPGLQIMLDGQPRTTPVDVHGLVGAVRTLQAPALQILDGAGYAFGSWSDGGAATHVIVAPEADTTYLASYTSDPDYDPTLVGHWALDAGGGGIAYDASGNGNDGTVSGAAWTSGVAGGALDFDDATDYVEVGTNGWTPDQGTVALWVWVNGFSGHDYFFGHTTQPAWANRIQLWTFGVEGWLQLGLGDQHFQHVNIADLDTNRWYHIALTWDGSSYVVYVDGVERAQGAYTGLSALHASADIGNSGFPSAREEALDGVIDEVRVYGRPLAPQEIEALVADASPNHPPLLDPLEDPSLTQGTTLDVLASASDPDGDPVTLSAAGLPSFASFTDHADGTGTLSLAPGPGDAGSYDVTIVADDGFATDSRTIIVTVSHLGDDPALVGHWPLDTGGGGVAFDASGNGNDGTVGGAVWTDGVTGGALDFDDAGEYVAVGTNGWTPDQGTVALWARASSFSADHNYLFGHTTQPAWANRIQLFTYGNEGQLQLGLGDRHFRHTDIKALDTNTWYHFALTWDGASYVVYVDGVPEASGTYTGLSGLHSAADLGNSGPPTPRYQALDGRIDEVRVYSRPLAPQEIGALVAAASANPPPRLDPLADPSSRWMRAGVGSHRQLGPGQRWHRGGRRVERWRDGRRARLR